jgi:hypothetical protein
VKGERLVVKQILDMKRNGFMVGSEGEKDK